MAGLSGVCGLSAVLRSVRTVTAGPALIQHSSGLRMYGRCAAPRHDTRAEGSHSHSGELPEVTGSLPPARRECLAAPQGSGGPPPSGRFAYLRPAPGPVLPGETTHLHRSIIYYFLSRLWHFP
ncbi:hypothetical protein GCM10010505_68700 [Kitasatospora aburaviensis]